LDRDLAPARLGPLHFHFRRATSLLIDLLIGRRFVADVEFLHCISLKEEDLGLFRNAKVFLVENRAAKGETLQISSLAVGVSESEHTVPFRQSTIDQVRSDEHLLRQ